MDVVAEQRGGLEREVPQRVMERAIAHAHDSPPAGSYCPPEGTG